MAIRYVHTRRIDRDTRDLDRTDGNLAKIVRIIFWDISMFVPGMYVYITDHVYSLTICEGMLVSYHPIIYNCLCYPRAIDERHDRVVSTILFS